MGSKNQFNRSKWKDRGDKQATSVVEEETWPGYNSCTVPQTLVPAGGTVVAWTRDHSPRRCPSVATGYENWWGYNTGLYNNGCVEMRNDYSVSLITQVMCS